MPAGSSSRATSSMPAIRSSCSKGRRRRRRSSRSAMVFCTSPPTRPRPARPCSWAERSGSCARPAKSRCGTRHRRPRLLLLLLLPLRRLHRLRIRWRLRRLRVPHIKSRIESRSRDNRRSRPPVNRHSFPWRHRPRSVGSRGSLGSIYRGWRPCGPVAAWPNTMWCSQRSARVPWSRLRVAGSLPRHGPGGWPANGVSISPRSVAAVRGAACGSATCRR